MFEEHSNVPKTRDVKRERNSTGGPNGIRTRVSALRGPCPGPLDDGAGQVLRKQRRMRQQLTQNLLAGGGGFEPPLRGPEPRVLPLDDPPPTHPTLPHPQTTQPMAVLSARLGRKRGTLVVGIWISLPVRGLRPLRAARRATTNVPNPEIVTRRPRRSDSTMLPTNAFMARSADVFELPAFFAMIATSSALVTRAPRPLSSLRGRRCQSGSHSLSRSRAIS